MYVEKNHTTDNINNKSDSTIINTSSTNELENRLNSRIHSFERYQFNLTFFINILY